MDKNIILVLGLVTTYVLPGLSWRFVERPLQRRYRERLKAPAPLDGSKVHIA